MLDDKRIASATEEALRAVLMADRDGDFVDMTDGDFEELLESMREAREMVRAARTAGMVSSIFRGCAVKPPTRNNAQDDE
jgi:hypothetical protein